MSVRQAAAACAVTQPVVRRWLSLGLLPKPPWTIQQLHEVRDLTDPERRRRGSRAAHGTMARWNAGWAAPTADGCKATRPENGDEPSRRAA